MNATMQHRPVAALMVRVAGVLALSTTVMLVKLSNDRGVHLAEILFWRQFLTVPITLLWLSAVSNLGVLKTNRFRDHLGRAMLGMIAMAFAFGSVILLPLAEAQTLNFTVPIFATVLAMFLLGERIGKWRWSALCLGFGGIIIITEPGGANHIPPIGVAVGLTAAFMIALLSIIIKELNRTERPIAIVFWFASLSCPLMALSLPFVMTSHDMITWALLLALGLCGGIGQILLTVALRYGAVSSVVVMDYTGIIWATLYGWLLWDQLPPTSTWLGAPLIVAAGLVIAWREHTLARARAMNI